MRSELYAVRSVSVACFICLNVLDVVTTFFGTRLGFVEGNYLPSTILATGGEAAMYTFKAFVAWLLVAFLIRLSARYRRLWYALHTANALLAIVVLGNLATVLNA